MKDDYNSHTEGNVLNYLSSSIENVKGKLASPLEEYRMANSVINNSVSFIENHVNMPSQQNEISFDANSIDGVDPGMEQSRANVRVRTMEGPHGFVSSNPVSTGNNNSQGYYSGYSDGFNQPTSKTGSVTTLILAGTAVLVMLVVFVSLFIMNFVGF